MGDVNTFLGIIFLAIIVMIVLVIRYGVNRAVDKGADAIGNAITRKRNSEVPPKAENLADLYRTSGNESFNQDP